MSGDRIVVDFIDAVCNSCRKPRRYTLEDPLVGAEALMAFFRSGVIEPCPCGGETADMRCHLVEPRDDATRAAVADHVHAGIAEDLARGGPPEGGEE